MEEAACGRSHVRFGLDVRAGTRLVRRITADRLGLRELAQPLEALDQNRNIDLVGEKAMSIRSGARGSFDLSETRPRDAGFISKTAALIS
jgi:hypothetical protein